MTPNELVVMGKRIHDVEGYNLGTNSSRDYRTDFWERVMGCAYWGHPVYNLIPDPKWHCKDPDGPTGGRPSSDDVAVAMPGRQSWDCIQGAGADGYRFEASDMFILDDQQFVFVPSKPAGYAGTVPPGSVPPVGQPPAQPYPDEKTWWEEVFDVEAAKRYAKATPPQAYPNPRSARWSNRTAYDIAAGMTKEASMAKHLAELDQELGL